MTPAGTAPLRACGHCTAAKNVTGMVIIRARPRDYLCPRHQQWLRGIHRPSLAALPEVTDSQRRHDRRTAEHPRPGHRTRPPASPGHHRPVARIRMASRAHRTLARPAPPPGRRAPRTRGRARRRDHPPRDARRRTPADRQPAHAGHPATGNSRPARLPLPQPPAPARPAPEPPVPVTPRSKEASWPSTFPPGSATRTSPPAW